MEGKHHGERTYHGLTPYPLTHTSPELHSLSPYNVVIYIPCHYDFSQLEYVAPFLERFHGSKVFIYKWHGLKDKIREHYLAEEYQKFNVGVYDFTLENMVSSILQEDPSKKVVFLSTASIAYAFGQYQRKVLAAVQEAVGDRVWGSSVVGHCMYGCASCKGNDHKIPVYFTRYFRKQLTYDASTIRKQYLRPLESSSVKDKPIPILVTPSTGTTSLLLQKEILDKLLLLQAQGKYEFVFKLHPACFNVKSYDMSIPCEKLEFENLEFIHANFAVTSEQQPCLLPFFEAFDIILCDLHSSVGFMASYFSPRIILAYHNDTGYEVPDRDPKFLAGLSVFDDLAGLEKYLIHEPLPPAKGSPDFFYQTYGHVDGNEVDRFAKLANWPLKSEKQLAANGGLAPTVASPLESNWRKKVLAVATKKWKAILMESVEARKSQPEDADEFMDYEAKLAMGISTSFEVRDDDRSNGGMVRSLESKAGSVPLKVMSLNIWHGGEAHPAHHSLEQTVRLILDSGADIIGIQEASGLPKDPAQPDKRDSRLSELAPILTKLDGGKPWHVFDQGVVTPGPRCKIPWGIVSRLPFTKKSHGKWGAEVEVTAGGKRVWIFNAHFPYFPYQPYQVNGIPYENSPELASEAEVRQSSLESRGREVQSLLADIKASVVGDGQQQPPVFLTGDFNEPSHLDWSLSTYVSGAHPIACQWPGTLAVVKDGGFTDTYRSSYPNEISHPAFTWTPRKPLDCHLGGFQPGTDGKPTEHHDRIDFVFAKGDKLRLLDSVTVGPARAIGGQSEDGGVTQMKLFADPQQFPTDHRAVLSTFELD